MRYFAGGNTAEGFQSCFGDILPTRAQRRMFYIKGGPGVGKSSLMKQVGSALEAKGEKVEYFYCSSDPDSLDGVAAPALGVGMMDGTAPHVYDPVIPGGRDTLVSLGDYLDEKKLQQNRSELIRLTCEIGNLFRRAYAYLGAASRVLAATGESEQAPQAVARLCGELTERYLPLRGGRGKKRELYISAYTPKGFMSFISDLPREKCVSLTTEFGQNGDAPLRALMESSLSRGLDIIALRDPLLPDVLAHLYLPDFGILFTTDTIEDAAETIALAELYPPTTRSERERSFDRNAYELMLLRAVEQIKTAKTLHDELETYYVSAMDFLRWQQKLDSLLQELS
ncbi:MAG: hypothetical protein EOM69_08470 [Clostridia bacterium]|nr:hypothetical protein [Clostridia bacterium]